MPHKVELPSDTDLVVKAINAIRTAREAPDDWLHGRVSEVFGLGYEAAQALCERFGFNPFEGIGGRR
jgi:hypothetical protein